MNPTLPSLLADIRNLSYLFVGFALVWVVVLGYIWTVSRQTRDLHTEIEELKNSVDPQSRKDS
jgi:CcmD family protein